MANRKSTPHGPRTRYMLAILATGKGKIVSEEFEYKKELATEASADDAKQKFMEKHNQEPTNVFGPYSKPATNLEDKRDTVTIAASNLRYTSKDWTGTFQGWNVVAHGVRGFDKYSDDELVTLSFVSRVSEDDETPKPKFRADMAVPKDLVADLQESY